MRAFLSHVRDEASQARALKRAIEAALPGCEVFVSASDIQLGDAWLEEIKTAMRHAKVLLALCSPSSVRRPWLNFESGSGWAKRLPVIPVCHRGLRKDRLPDPIGIFQGVELADTDACLELIQRLARVLKLTPAADFDAAGMLQSLARRLPARQATLGIVHSHQQQQWDGGPRNVLALAAGLPAGLQGAWHFRALNDERAFLREDLHTLSGLILASPWRDRMQPETIDAIVEWVQLGGRLLLLGFELGDRHHGANLAELSHHFGIDPGTDIVGPAGHGEAKPYDIPVSFDPALAEAHRFTAGLAQVQLENTQTVRVEPGGLEWLRVGANLVYRPRRDSVRYRDGTMTSPGGSTFEANACGGWLAVAVQAPRGLCGDGGVNMIGTWDLLGRNRAFAGDNLRLVTRLLDWLSGSGE